MCILNLRAQRSRDVVTFGQPQPLTSDYVYTPVTHRAVKEKLKSHLTGTE